MSQKTVERLLGKLATDEEVRQRFRAAPREALASFTGEIAPLTSVEMDALSALVPDILDRFADVLDPRLQRVRLPLEVPDGRKR